MLRGREGWMGCGLPLLGAAVVLVLYLSGMGVALGMLVRDLSMRLEHATLAMRIGVGAASLVAIVLLLLGLVYWVRVRRRL